MTATAENRALIERAMADPLLEGVKVVWVEGWGTAGRTYGTLDPQGVVVHHTATSRRAVGDYPSLGIVRDGRSDLPGPLSQFGLGRSGAIYVIAAGVANHAGPGGWRGLAGNATVWGVEAENDGIGEPWSAAQLRNYPRLCAALCRAAGFGPEMVCAHREWSPYKIDPTGIDMVPFRSSVASLLAAPTPQPEKDSDSVAFVFDDPTKNAVCVSDGVYWKRIRGGGTWAALEAAGVKHIGVQPGLTNDLIDAEGIMHALWVINQKK